MPTTAEAHRVGFKGPHVAHACGAPLGGDIESDTYKRISREAHAARTQHRLLSSGAIGLTISSNYFVSDHRCASLLACLRC